VDIRELAATSKTKLEIKKIPIMDKRKYGQYLSLAKSGLKVGFKGHQKGLEDAIEFSTYCLRVKESAEIYFIRGQAKYFLSGEPTLPLSDREKLRDGGLNEIRQACEMDYKNYEYLKKYGTLLLNVSKVDEAKDVFNKLVLEAPNDEAYVGKAECLVRSDNQDEAIPMLEKIYSKKSHTFFKRNELKDRALKYLCVAYADKELAELNSVQRLSEGLMIPKLEIDLKVIFVHRFYEFYSKIRDEITDSNEQVILDKSLKKVVKELKKDSELEKEAKKSLGIIRYAWLIAEAS
jgi:tetratricopeptide (TPR) repeat protein